MCKCGVPLEWRTLWALDKELIDKLLDGYQKPEDLIGKNGLLKQLTKALVERALNAGTDPPPSLRKEQSGRPEVAATLEMEKVERS